MPESSLLLERLSHDGQVLATKSVVNDLLPLVSEAGKNRKPVLASRSQRKVHVLERQRQRKLG